MTEESWELISFLERKNAESKLLTGKLISGM